MASSFSFSFSGDDIDEDAAPSPPPPRPLAHSVSAFPVEGRPLLPPVHHDLRQMLAKLPSKIAFDTLEVELGDRHNGSGTATATARLPRRELWDVRVQLMAEADGEADGDEELEPGLGRHDVKTGIYEGGFKSWESSIDLVKVLATDDPSQLADRASCRVIEVRPSPIHPFSPPPCNRIGQAFYFQGGY